MSQNVSYWLTFNFISGNPEEGFSIHYGKNEKAVSIYSVASPTFHSGLPPSEVRKHRFLAWTCLANQKCITSFRFMGLDFTHSYNSVEREVLKPWLPSSAWIPQAESTILIHSFAVFLAIFVRNLGPALGAARINQHWPSLKITGMKKNCQSKNKQQ